MTKITFIVLSALIGLFVIIGLNSGEIAQLGLGFELPVGWTEPVPEENITCILERDDKGLPFTYLKPVNGCETGTNTLAQYFNFVIGIAIGGIIGLAVQKKLNKIK